MTDTTKDLAITFDAARKAYYEARACQRKQIVDALEAAGLAVTETGGRGVKGYVNPSRKKKGLDPLDPPFDLSGWMWVKVKAKSDDESFVFVTLQVLDQDLNNKKDGGIHALMDRIGIEASNHPKTPFPLFEEATTNLQLPLNLEDLEELVMLVKEKLESMK